MKKNGFTLLELIIAIAVGAILMTAIYGAMIMAQRTTAGLGKKVITQQDTRAVLDFMAAEIRMASFNPSMTEATWTHTETLNNLNCGQVTVVTGAIAASAAKRGILYADANNIYIAMDLSADGVIGKYCSCTDPNDCVAVPAPACANDGGTNEYIFYSYSASSAAAGASRDQITRNVSCSGNAALLGGSAPGTVVINQQLGIDVFEYFDKDGNQITNPNANIPNIRRVRITIAAETDEIDINTGVSKKMINSTDVLVRNHAVYIP
ncbi:MAG TPA: prepilin-type N-terminal cleavage/methylation domain-containing protein [Deltaproteobacteria bacterium]|nr:prepilin-type N-terminal cleavage/methylation domain-containing protein [Deltaproteobacteria bacterium]